MKIEEATYRVRYTPAEFRSRTAFLLSDPQYRTVVAAERLDLKVEATIADLPTGRYLLALALVPETPEGLRCGFSACPAAAVTWLTDEDGNDLPACAACAAEVPS